MKVNFDNLRKQLSISMSKLRDKVEKAAIDLPRGPAIDLQDHFDEVAQQTNMLHALYDDNDEMFNEIPDEYDVKYFEEE